MSSEQVGLVVNIAIYAGLIGFVLYRQMTPQPLRGRRLVLLPAALGLLGLQQLGRQHLAADFGTVGFLSFNLSVSFAAGVWRGTTFRVWSEGGTLMTKGTLVTLVAWGVLIAIRLPFAYVSHVANLSQGLVVGELLLALAATFAAQNAVIWLRSGRLAVVPAISQ
jgi:hypothetical protein